MHEKFDWLIVGAGIAGMTIAHSLLKRFPGTKIAIVEKESNVGFHASGRNSGVLHAGFYYTADSLKAKFTRDGNLRMRTFCRENNIPVRETRKVVVAQNPEEVAGIHELERRAGVNGVDVKIITEAELAEIDPNVRTHGIALFSPNTASVDPRLVCAALKLRLEERGVKFFFDMPFKDCPLEYGYLVNCAGLYADKIAREFGAARHYTLLPFKGIYLKYKGGFPPVKINVYPVPDLDKPFLGVHYTVTADGSVKIGPTAIPAFWRENYEGFSRFDAGEMFDIVCTEAKLFFSNAFNFRTLAIEEMRNYHKNTFVGRAKKMVRSVTGDFVSMPAGIRAQLLDVRTGMLVTDFAIEHKSGSSHVLNAVSPAFTCAFAFADHAVEEIRRNAGGDVPPEEKVCFGRIRPPENESRDVYAFPSPS